MKYLFWVLCIFVFYNCKNPGKGSRRLETLNQIQNTNNKNDTFCSTNLSRFNLSKIRMIAVCQIIYSDSLNDATHKAYGGGKLSELFNFDRGSDYLAFNRAGDTIQVKFLTFAKSSNYRVQPKELKIKGDTLYISEEGLKVSNFKEFAQPKFEEIYYKFLLKDNRFHPIIVHLR